MTSTKKAQTALTDALEYAEINEPLENLFESNEEKVESFNRIDKAFKTMEETGEVGEEGTTELLAQGKPRLPNETVNIPAIGTYLSDREGSKKISPSEETVLIDTVSYKNLIPGIKYEMQGALYYINGNPALSNGKPIETSIMFTPEYFLNSNGEEILVSEKPVTAEVIFTPSKSSGTVELEFKFDSTGFEGDKVVAFVRLYVVDSSIIDEWPDEPWDEEPIAEHEDPEDPSQTVEFNKDSVNVGITTKTLPFVHLQKSTSEGLFDTATVTGDVPTDSWIVFELWKNNGGKVSGDTKVTEVKVEGVSAAGEYNSPKVKVSKTGVYYWIEKLYTEGEEGTTGKKGVQRATSSDSEQRQRVLKSGI